MSEPKELDKQEGAVHCCDEYLEENLRHQETWIKLKKAEADLETLRQRAEGAEALLKAAEKKNAELEGQIKAIKALFRTGLDQEGWKNG